MLQHWKNLHLEHFGLLPPHASGRLLLVHLCLFTWKQAEPRGYNVARSCSNIKTNSKTLAQAVSPKMLVRNYCSVLCNIPEQRRFHLQVVVCAIKLLLVIQKMMNHVQVSVHKKTNPFFCLLVEVQWYAKLQHSNCQKLWNAVPDVLHVRQ
jgi:hypothetical protein